MYSNLSVKHGSICRDSQMTVLCYYYYLAADVDFLVMLMCYLVTLDIFFTVLMGCHIFYC